VYILLIASFAITYRITIGNLQLPYLDFKFIRWAFSPFRASSRFMWILAYCLIILAAYLLLKRLKSQLVTLLLFFVLVFQALDLAPALEHRFASLDYSTIKSVPINHSQSQLIKEISRGKSRLVVYPPTSQIAMPSLAYEAWKNNLVSGMVQSSRLNYALASRLEKVLREKICADSYPESWLVVIPVSEIETFSNCKLDYSHPIPSTGLVYLKSGSNSK
jgi:hypothetical protein